MDRDGGPGYAIAKAKEVSDFVRDKQEVRISWGDVVSYDGFIKWFEAARESEGEIEWKLHILIDEDNLAEPAMPDPAPPSPRDSMLVIQQALLSANDIATLPSLRPTVLDALRNAISTVGAATGALAGSLTDVGINDDFINRVRDSVTPGTSALFVLSSDAVVDRIKEALAAGPKGDLIFTSLSAEEEAALREVFSE